MNILKTKTYRTTWNGRPGTMTEHRLTKSSTGLRIVVMHFDGEHPTVQLVKGDGRLPSFVRYTEQMLSTVEALPELVRATANAAETLALVQTRRG